MEAALLEAFKTQLSPPGSDDPLLLRRFRNKLHWHFKNNSIHVPAGLCVFSAIDKAEIPVRILKELIALPDERILGKVFFHRDPPIGVVLIKIKGGIAV